MKKLLLAFLVASNFAMASEVADTTIIEFNDKALNNKIKVITNGDKSFTIPKILNLNNILRAIGVDSSEREKAFVLVQKGDDNMQDTILVVSREGQRVKIVTNSNAFDKIATSIEKSKTSENNDKETVDREDNFENHSWSQNRDSHKNKMPSKPKKFFSKSDFAFYLGINNFINGTPSAPFNQFKLRTFQSRYAAISFRKNATLIRGKNADLAFSYGPEMAWYNFMLENSKKAIDENGQVSFINNPKNTQKSKLVMPFLNFPVMLNVGFKEDKFKMGFGGYVGYRVGGYTREKFENGGKNKVKGDFGMTDISYGLTTEFGKKNGTTIFFRYDLNTLFQDNQKNGKEIQTFSVGFRLM